jgi:hypothetical protein
MASDKTQPQGTLEALLNRLEERADNELLSRLTFFGRALSKSQDSLHLATESGIVAIPLSEIEDVAADHDPEHPDVVTVVVRHGDAVRHLLRVNPLPAGGGPAPSAGGFQTQMPGGGGEWCPPGYTCHYACQNSATLTGLRPKADATDDYVCKVWIEDQWA